MEDTTMSTLEAKGSELLQKIFSNGDAWIHRSEGCDVALSILHRVPSLAVCRLQQLTPLQHFLRSVLARDRLDIIQHIYHLQEQQEAQTTPVRAWQLEEPTPLHTACRSEFASEEAIAFLMEQEPSHATIRNSLGLSPLAYLLMNTGTNSNMAALLKRLLPHGSAEVLAYAMSLGCTQEVYDTLLPDNSTSFRLCSEFTMGSDRLGLLEAQILCKMLPQLTRLTCQPREWTLEALNLFCEALTHSSLEELDISLPLDMPHQYCHWWTTLLQSSTTIKTLKIQAETHGILKHIRAQLFQSLVSTHINDTPLLDSILRGLATNTTLQTLELSCFKFPEQYNNNTSIHNPSSSLTTLKLSNCYLPSYDGLNALLQPTLQTLSITFRQQPHHPAPPDMTDTLVDIFDRLPHLQSLTIGKGDPTMCDCVAHHPDRVLQALQHTPCLRSLSVYALLERSRHCHTMQAILQEGCGLQAIGHATYGDCLYTSAASCDDDETAGRIPYYLLLNQCGRQRVRREDLTKAELVEVLEQVPDRCGGYEHDLLLDLLLEAPSVWASQLAS